MKKILLSVSALLILAIGGFVAFQNRPVKRHARHLVKARLFAQEGNLTAAKLEYEKAYNILDGFTPFVSVEVLQLMNRMSMQEKNLPEAFANTKSFVEKHGHNDQGWLILAELAIQSRDATTAFAALDTLMARDPKNFPARLMLARIRTQQGRLDLAEEQLRTLYTNYPDSIASLLPLAENLLRQGHVAESRGFLKMAMEQNPKNTMVRLLLVDGYLLERKIDSAQALFDAWKEADPSLGLPIAIRKSNLFALQGKLEEARAAIQPFLGEKKEENFAAFSEWAVIEAKMGHYDTAVKVYGMMEDIRPASRGEIWLLKAHLNLKNREPARALEALKLLNIGSESAGLLPLQAATYIALDQAHKVKDMLEKLPDSLKPRLQAFVDEMPADRDFIGQWALVNFYQMNKQGYWVFTSAKELHEKYPKSTLATAMLSSNLASIGRFAEAAQLLEGMAGRSKAQDPILLNLYIRARQPEKARALAEKLIAAEPKTHGLNLFLADYWFTGRDRAKGVAYYEKELALDPDNLVCLNNLAWEYGIVRKDLEKARPYLERLKAKQAGDPRVMDTIGWILIKNGDGSGLAMIDQSVKLVPDHPAFRYHLAFALSAAGRKEEAKEQLKAALESKIPFEEKAEAQLLSAQL